MSSIEGRFSYTPKGDFPAIPNKAIIAPGGDLVRRRVFLLSTNGLITPTMFALSRKHQSPSGLHVPFLIAFVGVGLTALTASAQLSELATTARGIKSANPAPV